jgi:MFS transporter, DHA1 family, multidrug resistance protein
LDRSRAQILIFGSAAIGALGNFANHAILPALAVIRAEFAGSVATTQLLVSLALFALAMGNLTVAPLSDRFGRRPVILCGLILYSLCAAAGSGAGSIAAIVAARVAMAVGSGGAQSVSRAALMDFFGPERAASGLAYTSTVSLLVPMIAPTIGGYLVEFANWRWIFGCCALLGAAALALVWFRMGETHIKSSTAASDRPSFASYRELLRSNRFVTQVLFGSCMLALPYTVISGAPYVGIELMGLAPSSYGKLFAMPAFGSFVGFYSAARFTRRFGNERMMQTGLIVAAVGASAMAICFALHLWHPMALFLPAMVLCFSNAIAMPGSMSSAIAVRPDIAGAASGLLGFAQLSLSACCAELVALLANHTPYPFVGCLLGLVCCAAVIWLIMRRQRRC